jgi:hypothetical protein
MYFERARDKKIVKNGTADVTTPGLRRYFTKDNQASLDKPIEFCEQLINLAKIWDKVSAYPVIQVLLKFNKNSKLFLASYFHRFKVDDISEETVNEIAICLLRLFAVLAIVDTSYSSKKFKVFLFKEVEKLADSTISVQEIKVDFDKHISSSWKHDEERNEIEEYISEYDGDELVYLNEYLFAKEIGCGFSLESNYNIEHIMPQSGAKAKHDDIRKDARIKNDEEFKDTVDKLGNKILLEEKINKSLGNDWFRSKLSGYKNSCYPIATALVKEYENVPKPEWTKEKIDKATDRASERIVKFIFSDK